MFAQRILGEIDGLSGDARSRIDGFKALVKDGVKRLWWIGGSLKFVTWVFPDGSVLWVCFDRDELLASGPSGMTLSGSTEKSMAREAAEFVVLTGMSLGICNYWGGDGNPGKWVFPDGSAVWLEDGFVSYGLGRRALIAHLELEFYRDS